MHIKIHKQLKKKQKTLNSNNFIFNHTNNSLDKKTDQDFGSRSKSLQKSSNFYYYLDEKKNVLNMFAQFEKGYDQKLCFLSCFMLALLLFTQGQRIFVREGDLYLHGPGSFIRLAKNCQYTFIYTACPRSSYPFYLVTYFTKWVTTS